MLNIRLICVGKLKERFYTDAANEYLKRLRGFCKADVLEIPEQRLPDKPSAAEISAALEKEGTAISEKLINGALIAALCVEGLQMDSFEFAKTISLYTSQGTSKMCFVIGGSNGLCDKIKDEANIKLSISKMTLPHHLARIILLEQIYRAFKINEGGKYHK